MVAVNTVTNRIAFMNIEKFDITVPTLALTKTKIGIVKNESPMAVSTVRWITVSIRPAFARWYVLIIPGELIDNGRSTPPAKGLL